MLKFEVLINKLHIYIITEIHFYTLVEGQQKFATQGRRSFQPHNLYTFLISITRRVDPAMTVCPILGILSKYDDETF